MRGVQESKRRAYGPPSGWLKVQRTASRAGEFVRDRARQLSAMHHAPAFRDEKCAPRSFQIKRRTADLDGERRD